MKSLKNVRVLSFLTIAFSFANAFSLQAYYALNLKNESRFNVEVKAKSSEGVDVLINPSLTVFGTTGGIGTRTAQDIVDCDNCGGLDKCDACAIDHLDIVITDLQDNTKFEKSDIKLAAGEQEIKWENKSLHLDFLLKPNAPVTLETGRGIHEAYPQIKNGEVTLTIKN